MANWGKIIGIIGSAIGGSLLGAGAVYLIDKSKIDSLQGQVMTLQEQVKKLEKIVADRESVVEKLTLKLKITAMENTINSNDNARVRLVFMYALKDYSEIYVKRLDGKDIYENDLVFFKAMDDFIEGRNVTNASIVLITNRVMLRYGTQIEGSIEANFDQITNYLESLS